MAARAVTAACVTVPTWVVTWAVVHWRAPATPLAGLGLEALALAAVGIAIGAGLRAWRDQRAPGFLASLGVVGFAFATNAPPRWYVLQQGQTWGPPWEAAQIRWLGLLLIAIGVLVLATRDPLSRDPRNVGARDVAPSSTPVVLTSVTTSRSASLVRVGSDDLTALVASGSGDTPSPTPTDARHQRQRHRSFGRPSTHTSSPDQAT